MLKIRYNILTAQLTGWTDNELEFDQLLIREGEGETLIDAIKPQPSNDYEWWCYEGVGLVRSDKALPPEPPRNLAAEVDELKARLDSLGVK